MELYMLFPYTRNPRYGHLTLTLVTGDGQGSWTYIRHAPHYAGFVIDTQHDAGSDRFYGSENGYRNPSFVSLKRAKVMTRQLRAIDRHLGRCTRAHGLPVDFVDYATRVMRFLNVRGIFVWKKQAEYDLHPIEDLGNLIESGVRAAMV